MYPHRFKIKPVRTSCKNAVTDFRAALPARGRRGGRVTAEASLYIYLTHFQVYPLFDGHPLLGVVASVLIGVLLTYLVTVLRKRIRLSLGSLSSAKVPALR